MSGGIVGRDFKTFRRTTPSSAGRSGIDRFKPHLLCRENRVLCILRLSEIVSCRLPHLNWITSENHLKWCLMRYLTYWVHLSRSGVDNAHRFVIPAGSVHKQTVNENAIFYGLHLKRTDAIQQTIDFRFSYWAAILTTAFLLEFHKTQVGFPSAHIPRHGLRTWQRTRTNMKKPNSLLKANRTIQLILG